MTKGVPKLEVPHNPSDVGIEWRIYSRLAMRRIPEDEPIFVLRGSDPLAVQALISYHQLLVSQSRGSETPHSAATLSKLRDFQQFQQEHPDRMEIPGTQEKR